MPVLSNSSTFPCASVSSAPPPFTMIPRRAAREIPATTAMGTARISGHGVATTSTRQRPDGVAGEQPGGARDRQRHGDEDHGVPVGHSHERRLLLLRLLDQAHDTRVRALGGSGHGSEVDGRSRVHRSGSDRISFGPLGRAGLAGERRLVEHAGRHQHAVDRDDLAGLHEQAVARPHVVDRADDQLAILVSRDHLGSAIEEGGELAVGPSVRVGLKRLAAGEHQRDHGTGQVLAERQRAGHGQQGDQVDACLAPDQTHHRLPGERHQPDRRGHGPHGVGRVVGPRPPRDASGGDAHDGHGEPQVRQVLRLAGLVAHESTLCSSASRCSAIGVSSVAMSVR